MKSNKTASSPDLQPSLKKTLVSMGYDFSAIVINDKPVVLIDKRILSLPPEKIKEAAIKVMQLSERMIALSRTKLNT